MKNEKPNVLLVDDSSTNNLLLESAFLEFDFNITTVTNGEAAIKCLEKKHYSLVLLDVMMPGLSGYEVLEKMNEAQLLKDTSVILVTARCKLDEEKKARALGATDYFEKPIELKKLIERVKELVSQTV